MKNDEETTREIIDKYVSIERESVSAIYSYFTDLSSTNPEDVERAIVVAVRRICVESTRWGLEYETLVMFFRNLDSIRYRKFPFKLFGLKREKAISVGDVFSCGEAALASWDLL